MNWLGEAVLLVDAGTTLWRCAVAAGDGRILGSASMTPPSCWRSWVAACIHGEKPQGEGAPACGGTTPAFFLRDVETAALSLACAARRAEGMAGVTVDCACIGLPRLLLRPLRAETMTGGADRKEAEVEARRALLSRLLASHAEGANVAAVRADMLSEGSEEAGGAPPWRAQWRLLVAPGSLLRFLRRLLACCRLEYAGCFSTLNARAERRLSGREKENGALFVDMGALATDYAVYEGGVAMTCGTVALGADAVAADLAAALSLDIGAAERLRRRFRLQGEEAPPARPSAAPAGKTGKAGKAGKAGKTSWPPLLAESVIRARGEEILNLVASALTLAPTNGVRGDRGWACVFAGDSGAETLARLARLLWRRPAGRARTPLERGLRPQFFTEEASAAERAPSDFLKLLPIHPQASADALSHEGEQRHGLACDYS